MTMFSKDETQLKLLDLQVASTGIPVTGKKRMSRNKYSEKSEEGDASVAA